MYNKEELKKQNARDLMKLATSIGIKGAWKKRKDEVIDLIISTVSPEEPEKMAEIVNSEKRPHINYVENVEIGVLVAFTLPDGKVKSGKVMKKSTKGRKLMVETEYEAKYLISFDDVIWVKTGTRWPRFVYNRLKGRK